MKRICHHCGPLTPCFYLIAGCLAFVTPASAADAVAGGEKALAVEKPLPKSKTPMMDILVMELLKGEPINEAQAKQVINREFGPIWRGENAEPADPADSQEVRSAKFHVQVYLAAVKASLLDPENHAGWPTGYAKLQDKAVARLMLAELKAKALLPMNKVNRTIVNYAIITPAWICDDQEAMALSDKQRAADWPADSFVAVMAAALKAKARVFHTK